MMNDAMMIRLLDKVDAGMDEIKVWDFPNNTPTQVDVKMLCECLETSGYSYTCYPIPASTWGLASMTIIKVKH